MDKNIGKTFGITDQELIEELGLDPSLAGKDAINAAAKSAVRNQMKTELMNQGLSEDMADREAVVRQRDNMS